MSAVVDPIETGNPRSTATGILPPVPESLEELAIPPSIIEQLLFIYLYFRGEMLGREMGSQLTNVLRCLYLEARGYQVMVTELVGWEHSLKNGLHESAQNVSDADP